MKKILNKYKAAIIIFLIIAVFVLVYFLGQRPVEPTPTPQPVVFQLKEMFPPGGKHEVVIPNFALHFTFSKPIDLSGTAIKVEPFLDFEISTDDAGKILYLVPTPQWQFNTTYRISINTKSKDGESLDTPIEYSFTPVPLTTSELQERPQEVNSEF